VIRLHPEVKDRLDQIEHIEIATQKSAVCIIDKQGPLWNPADRDHCLQYMVAIGLIHGTLTAKHYDEAAGDLLIDQPREQMNVSENTTYSEGYLDPDKRSIANSVQVFFADGTATDCVEIEYPLGHRRRRKESVPEFVRKFEQNVSTRPPETAAREVAELLAGASHLDAAAVHDLVDATIDRDK